MRKRIRMMFATVAAVLVGFGATLDPLPVAALDTGSSPMAGATGCPMSAWAGGGVVAPLPCDLVDLFIECIECAQANSSSGWAVECLECMVEFFKCFPLPDID